MRKVTKTVYHTQCGQEFETLLGIKEFQGYNYKEKAKTLAHLLRRKPLEFAPSIIEQHKKLAQETLQALDAWSSKEYEIVKKEVWITSDSVEHKSLSDATRHAEKRYNDACDRLANSMANRNAVELTRFLKNIPNTLQEIVALRKDWLEDWLENEPTETP